MPTKKKDSLKAIVKCLAGKRRIDRSYAWDCYGAHTYDVENLIRRARRILKGDK